MRDRALGLSPVTSLVCKTKCMCAMQGPRQDAGLQTSVNMGVRTSAAIYNYAQQQGSSTRIVVTGLRTAEEVLALSGVDYMIVSERVCKKLADRGTLDGYNDGLAADQSQADCGIPALTPEAAMTVRFVFFFLCFHSPWAMSQACGFCVEPVCMTL